MPAFLRRDGEQLPQGMPPVIEQIRCTKDTCKISYTIYSNEPISMYGAEKSTDVMCSMAVAKIQGEHSFHGVKEFFWKGPDDGWRESDTVAQRKAL
jgi:hypothetical protein